MLEQDEFDKARRRFLFMPVRLILTDTWEKMKDFVAFIDRMRMVVNPTFIDAAFAESQATARQYCQGIYDHEMCHMFDDGAPNTFRDAIDYAEKLKAVLGDQECIAVHEFANVIYDVIVDVANYDLRQTPIDVVLRIAYKNFKELAAVPDLGKNEVVGAFLVAFREAAVGREFSGLTIDPDVRAAAADCVAICRERETMPRGTQVVKIGEILVQLFLKHPPQNGGGGKGQPRRGKGQPLTEEQKQALGELAEKIREAMAREGRPGRAPVKEDLESDAEASMMEQVEWEDKDEVHIVGSYLDYDYKLLEYWEARSKAKKKVNLRCKPTGRAPDEQFRIGSQVWEPGMDTARYDVVASIISAGRPIMGVSTLQPVYASGPGMPIEGQFPHMFVSADVSGSMNPHDTLIALFAMIEEAKKKRVKIGVTLFADSYWSHESTYDYEKLARAVYDHYNKVGRGNSVSGLEKALNLVPKDSLLLYITDFGLPSGDQSNANRQLSTLKGMGVQVVFVLMFTEGYAQSIKHPHVFCPQIERLSDLLLDVVD